MRSAFQMVDSPKPYQVFQRSELDTTDIEIRGTAYGDCAIEYRLANSEWHLAEVGRGVYTGVLRDIPVGGPYTVELRAIDEAGVIGVRRIKGLLVGDLWILAGQSNMDGCGKLINLEKPSRMGKCLHAG